MKNVRRITVVVLLSLLCMVWGSVWAVITWNVGAANDMTGAGPSVDPCKAILAAGIVGTAGIVIYLIRYKKRCSMG